MDTLEKEVLFRTTQALIRREQLQPLTDKVRISDARIKDLERQVEEKRISLDKKEFDSHQAGLKPPTIME
jgi:hypothetical protein